MNLSNTSTAGDLPDIPRTELVPGNYSPGKSVPWWVKMGSKLVLARLPVPYAVWRSLGVFKHGRSDAQWSRERSFASDCVELARSHLGRAPNTVLELGPGDSFVGALVAAANGAERIYVVDVGDFATVDVQQYRALVESLGAVSPGFPARVDLTSREAMLKSINASYHIGGLADLAQIPPGTVELSFSLKVLEHVRRFDFKNLIDLVSKASADRSIGRHIVDLHDHLGCRLNNLRFSQGFWEHRIVSNSGFYTNRWRMSEILDMARRAGFKVKVPHALVWPEVPTPRAKMHESFKGFDPADLKICMFEMVLEKGIR